jgi:hypothetical protein
VAKLSITEASRRAQDAAEADAIRTLVSLEGKGCGFRLLYPSAKLVKDKQDRRAVYLTLFEIAFRLSGAEAIGSDALWRGYQHHFIGDEKRARFFQRLRSHTRQVTTVLFIKFGRSKEDVSGEVAQAMQWDASLLPATIAPHVLWLAILYPGILEHFLPRFFNKISDATLYGSTYDRATLILLAVPRLGWSAKKHTNELREAGLLRPGKRRTQEQTVKKFIARLRKKNRDMAKFLSG